MKNTYESPEIIFLGKITELTGSGDEGDTQDTIDYNNTLEWAM